MTPRISNDTEWYQKLLDLIRLRFTGASKPLFTTNANAAMNGSFGLFPVYLTSLPESERQHHTCAACRRFVESFGDLVEISEDGKTRSALWDLPDVPEPYTRPIQLMNEIACHAKVTGVFVSSEKVYGNPITGQWTHFSATPEPSAVYASATKTSSQLSAEKTQDYLTVLTALKEFPPGAVDQAVAILQSDALYRSEKCLGVAEWLQQLHRLQGSTHNSRERNNILWRAVAKAPAGFCHPRSSVIGTLLEDIIAGLPFETISRRFSDKMHPLQYQRPQSAPSDGNIAQAESVIAKLQAAGALRRRYAMIEDLQTIWLPNRPEREVPTDGVFAHLRGKSKPPSGIEIPEQAMTWVKFCDTVLPSAKQIHYRVPLARGHYSALVTAADPDSPPVIQWDVPGARNPLSWYVYHGGSAPSEWNLAYGSFTEVNAITLQPSMWNGGNEHQGAAVFFILEGAHDSRAKTCGLGLFPEFLKSELHGIRATIEAFSRNGVIEGAESASACGLRIQKGIPANAEFRVTTDNGIINYTIDRWD